MKHLLSLIPLILLPILIVSSHVPLVFGRCREDQQSLLLQLKHDLNFEVSDSQKSVWWNASTDCCEWPGISCDPGGLGRVIGFHLNNEGITRGGGGGLNNSTALFSLRYLEYLDLSHNKFNTTIPAALGNLTNLRYLDLSHADFFGPIPASISQLTSLTSLNLSCLNCYLKLEIPNLSLIIRNLTQLTHLRLDGADLSAQVSSSLHNLKVLSLSDCSLSGPIDLSLSKLQSLSRLELDYNNFSSPIPNSLAEGKNLTYLSMRNCGLIGTFSKKIAQSLTLLDFSHNHLNGSFPTQYFNNQYTRLTFLSLSNNSLTGIIPTSICNLVDLKVVDFSNNYFNGTIPSCLLKDLRSLYVLDLRGNMLSGKIPDTFRASSALQTLDLSNNQLQGRIPESLENCNKLEVLDIGNNKITDVFPCIRGIKSSLRVLILRNNLFHGNIWCSYDDSFTWQRLQIVDLAFNKFSGVLNAKYLATWEAMMEDDHNSIIVSTKGRELEFVRILTVFKSIDLSSNNFDGPIPEVMGKFKALQVLNLSHNAFNGQIPSGFGNLSNVESLDLSHNKLTGEIPNEIAGLTFLSCMDLSDNYLVGRIPTGTQFQSFDNTSFGGNPDLCGQPLSKSCTDPPAPQNIIVNNGKSSVGIDWDILSKVFGFFCGLGLIMLPASLWPSFRIWFWPKIDYVILWMFPKLYTKDWNNRLRARKTRLRNKQRKAIQ
ncbi:Receptor-like protein 30 [Linum perenne]